jgi:hypothetical protein
MSEKLYSIISKVFSVPISEINDVKNVKDIKIHLKNHGVA